MKAHERSTAWLRGRPSQAADSELIRRLDAEWRVLSQSTCLRDRLLAWSTGDDRLAFTDGDELVSAAQRRDVASWAERDQVLSTLLERAVDDGLARRVALQVVLPGLKSLIVGIRGWDVEERSARVVATALDVISWCATEPAGTQPSFRIYSNTRRRVLRSAVRERSEPLVFVEDYRNLDASSEVIDASADEQRLETLVEWVQQRAHLREDAARLVVMSRAAGFSINELASSEHVDPQTLRQRRLRAERRVRRSLSLAL
ncbi:MAG: hypothetical protein P1T08_06530 [Acidimicrobiia bacterium]|nr:hypothetical protein [Acidimicrobiia bacterium]